MNTALAQQIANEGGVEAWMIAQQHKSLLRFLTCGSVDDGKSTLIGRLLHDTRQIYEDQLRRMRRDTDTYEETSLGVPQMQHAYRQNTVALIHSGGFFP